MQTIYSDSKKDPVNEIISWMKNENAKIFKAVSPYLINSCARLILSPFSVEIIDQSSDVSDLIKTALVYRKKYKNLRKWISEYKEAIEDENIINMSKKKNLLNDVSKYFNKFNSMDKLGKTKISMNFTLFNPGLKIDKDITAPKFFNKFGIRSSFINLILNSKGESIVKKLLKMFEYKKDDQFPKLIDFLQK